MKTLDGESVTRLVRVEERWKACMIFLYALAFITQVSEVDMWFPPMMFFCMGMACMGAYDAFRVVRVSAGPVPAILIEDGLQDTIETIEMAVKAAGASQ